MSNSDIESAGATQPAPNPATVLPIVLLVDVSNSMNIATVSSSATDNGGAAPRFQDTRLYHLLRVLDRLPRELLHVAAARNGGELAMVTFGGDGVKIADLRPGNARRGPTPTFVSLEQAELPERLTAGGHTPLAEALEEAVRIVRTRNSELAQRARYRANVWIITDGQGTDAESGLPVELPERSIARLRELESDRLALIFTAMLPGAEEREIARITPESRHTVADADFEKITQLLTVSSQSITDQSAPPIAIYRRLQDVLG